VSGMYIAKLIDLFSKIGVETNVQYTATATALSWASGPTALRRGRRIKQVTTPHRLSFCASHTPPCQTHYSAFSELALRSRFGTVTRHTLLQTLVDSQWKSTFLLSPWGVPCPPILFAGCTFQLEYLSTRNLIQDCPAQRDLEELDLTSGSVNWNEFPSLTTAKVSATWDHRMVFSKESNLCAFRWCYLRPLGPQKVSHRVTALRGSISEPEDSVQLSMNFPSLAYLCIDLGFNAVCSGRFSLPGRC
jgi:hypothetical protein